MISKTNYFFPFSFPTVITAFICTELKDALTDVGNTVHPYFEKHKLFRAAKFEAKKKKKL